MRKLMWFAVGFAAACAAGVYLFSGTWLLLPAVFCLAGAVLLFFVGTDYAKRAALVLLGLMAGFVWMLGHDHLYLSHARACDGQTLELTIAVTDYAEPAEHSVAADGTVTLDGKTYKVRFYLESDQTLSPGDVVEGSFRLRYTADGGENEPTYHQGRGVFLLASAKGETTLTKADRVPGKYFAATLRRDILALLDAVFPADTLAFARALLLGDSSLMDYETDTDLQISGIRHIIAVSGLHVSILFSLVYLFSGHRKLMTALLGFPALLVFAAVAGFTPSIVRACVMQSLVILALLFDKEYDPPTALAFAVLVILAVNPITVTSVSFQLSVMCMVGIFLFSDKLSSYLLDPKRLGPAKGKGIKARLTRWGVGSVCVTVSAMITTTPLCAWYFDMVSLVGIVTNLLTLWAVSFIFYGIMAACILGGLWLPAGKAIAWCISWPIRYVLLVADTAAAFPLAAVYTDSAYIVAWLIFCYVLLAVFLHLKKKHPVLLLSCMGVALAAAVAFSWIEPRLCEHRLTVMDVGQGQCILLQNEDQYYLIDCGGDTAEAAADTAAQQLLSQGITRLDGLILTHYDGDHAGGAQMLLSRVPADTLYLPDSSDENGLREELEAAYSDRIRWIGEDTSVQLANAVMDLYTAGQTASDNENSLCVLYQRGNYDILITGDRSASGERELLRKTMLPKLEVLIVGHHGAKSATSLELLHAAQPAVAVISVSADNAYGHPAQEVLERLDMMGCKILRTDLNGTVILGR